MDRRQEFILATLRQFGQVRRTDIIREFDVSTPQASTDIQNFLAANPALVKYDVSAKAYIIIEDDQPTKGTTHAQQDPKDPA